MRRRNLAVVLLAVLSAVLAMAFTPAPPGTVSNQFMGPRTNYWIINKTGNQGLTDTIRGPSVYAFGAKSVTAIVRANLGVCSLATWETSMNDTVYGAPQARIMASWAELFHTDSLNVTGGRFARIWAVDSTRTASSNGLPYQFVRLILRRKADNQEAADAELTGRIDSLRIGYIVQW